MFCWLIAVSQSPQLQQLVPQQLAAVQRTSDLLAEATTAKDLHHHQKKEEEGTRRRRGGAIVCTTSRLSERTHNICTYTQIYSV